MSDTEEETTVLTTESEADGPQGLIGDMKPSQVAFAGWVVAAGAYGYTAAKWGAGGESYPEYAGVFLVLGLSIGVAMAASIAAAGEDDDAAE